MKTLTLHPLMWLGLASACSLTYEQAKAAATSANTVQCGKAAVRVEAANTVEQTYGNVIGCSFKEPQLLHPIKFLTSHGTPFIGHQYSHSTILYHSLKRDGCILS